MKTMKLLHNPRPMGRAGRLALSASLLLPLVSFGALAAVLTASPAAAVAVGLPYNPLTPTRICDTRAEQTGVVAANQCNHNGTGTGTLGAAGTLTITVPSLPAGATAAVLNVTVTNTTAASYLTAWPTGATQPLVSNLNWVAGETVPNRVIVPVGTGGQVSPPMDGSASDPGRPRRSSGSSRRPTTRPTTAPTTATTTRRRTQRIIVRATVTP